MFPRLIISGNKAERKISVHEVLDRVDILGNAIDHSETILAYLFYYAGINRLNVYEKPAPIIFYDLRTVGMALTTVDLELDSFTDVSTIIERPEFLSCRNVDSVPTYIFPQEYQLAIDIYVVMIYDASCFFMAILASFTDQHAAMAYADEAFKEINDRIKSIGEIERKNIIVVPTKYELVIK